MTLDADSAEVLRRLAALGVRPMHELTPQGAREQAARMRPVPDASRPMHDEWLRSIPRDDGSSMRVKVLVPSSAPAGLIVYYHGGGWVVGTIEDYQPLCRELAAGTGCSVVIVDYRLAPEHLYPAAAQDAWRALEWAADAMAEFTGRQAPLLVAGDSSGGNLAAVVAQRSRAAGGPAIALQVLAYPVTDCDLDTESYREPENQLLLTRETMRWFWNLYVPDHPSRAHPGASPLREPELAGLPAAIVVTAEHDVLRDEGEAYAWRMRAAGVPVTLRRFTGQMHGFLSRFAAQPSAAAALAEVIEAVNVALNRHLAMTPQER